PHACPPRRSSDLSPSRWRSSWVAQSSRSHSSAWRMPSSMSSTWRSSMWRTSGTASFQRVVMPRAVTSSTSRMHLGSSMVVLLEEFGADGADDGHPEAVCLGGGEVAAAGLVFELGVGEPEPGERLAGGVVELGFGQLGHHVVRVVGLGRLCAVGLVAEALGVPVGEAALPGGVQGGPAGFGFL